MTKKVKSTLFRLCLIGVYVFLPWFVNTEMSEFHKLFFNNIPIFVSISTGFLLMLVFLNKNRLFVKSYFVLVGFNLLVNVITVFPTEVFNK